MAEAAFNTIAEVQRLRSAGIEQMHAEAITMSIHAGVTGGVATKADLHLLKADLESTEQRLEARIESIEQRLEARIESTAQDLNARIESIEQRLETRIESTAQDLNARIEKSEQRLETGIEKAKFDLTWRLLAGIGLINGAVLAALRYLPTG